MPRSRVYLSPGSNIAPERHLPQAVRRLAELGVVCGVSRVWQSRAVGDESQPDFCNAAVALDTDLTPEELLSPEGPLRQIEAELGRVRDPQNRNAARTIDIDLALCDRTELELGDKRLPDPEIFNRAFVAVPLAELPGADLPLSAGVSLGELARRLAAEQPLLLRADIVLPM